MYTILGGLINKVRSDNPLLSNTYYFFLRDDKEKNSRDEEDLESNQKRGTIHIYLYLPIESIRPNVERTPVTGVLKGKIRRGDICRRQFQIRHLHSDMNQSTKRNQFRKQSCAHRPSLCTKFRENVHGTDSIRNTQ